MEKSAILEITPPPSLLGGFFIIHRHGKITSMAVIEEFKAFAMRGSVVDLAVGVVIGASFNTIVNSLVADVIMPAFGVVTGNINFSELALVVGTSTIAYGKFIQATLSFIIIAFSLFLVIKAVNAMRKKEELAPEVVKPPSDEVRLLTEIRDLLQKPE